ncbi:MAG: dTDP-4-dehydrorhamnose 3,5-epimerase [Bacteroidota bacterium]
MEIIDTKIPDVKLIKPDVHGDDRGFFLETYRKNLFQDHGIDTEFVQDNCSYSHQGALRGLHYQIEQPQAKLVMVLKGTVLDVAVDIRRNSPTFGEHVAFELSGENKHFLYIPVGFAHGFAVLEDDTYFQYKCSDYYNPQGERGIRWNDPQLGIDWPLENPILSGKDQNLPLLNDVQDNDLFIYPSK